MKRTGLDSYEKIDDLCCIIANKYQDDFFSASKEYPDEGFIKDVNEMVDCLETIKENLYTLEVIKNIMYAHNIIDTTQLEEFLRKVSESKKNELRGLEDWIER